MDEYPELVHFEARGNGLQDIGELKPPKLQRLYLAANGLEKISFAENKPNLQVLHLRGNKIQRLDGLSEKSAQLTYLNLRGNKISSLEEIEKLSKLPNLRMLILAENPIASTETYRQDVLARLPKLDRLDKEPVTNEERDEALNASK